MPGVVVGDWEVGAIAAAAGTGAVERQPPATRAARRATTTRNPGSIGSWRSPDVGDWEVQTPPGATGRGVLVVLEGCFSDAGSI